MEKGGGEIEREKGREIEILIVSVWERKIKIERRIEEVSERVRDYAGRIICMIKNMTKQSWQKENFPEKKSNNDNIDLNLWQKRKTNQSLI